LGKVPSTGRCSVCRGGGKTGKQKKNESREEGRIGEEKQGLPFGDKLKPTNQTSGGGRGVEPSPAEKLALPRKELLRHLIESNVREGGILRELNDDKRIGVDIPRRWGRSARGEKVIATLK